jgi:glutathione S-transferase
MGRLCQFTPWIAGSQQTMADIYVFYVNAVVGSVGSGQLEWDILAQMPGMTQWGALMRDSEFSRTVDAGRIANQPGFAASIKAYMDGQ